MELPTSDDVDDMKDTVQHEFKDGEQVLIGEGPVCAVMQVCMQLIWSKDPSCQSRKVFQGKSVRVGCVRVCNKCTIREVIICTNKHSLREDMR